MFTVVFCVFLAHFNPAINHFGGFVIVKDKLTSVFYASVLLMLINFVITLSKFPVEIAPLRLVISSFHSYFDNVMTQYIINKKQTQFSKSHVGLFDSPEL